MRYRSKKTQAVYRQQRIPLVKELFEDGPQCMFPGCTAAATDPHEPITRGRGGSITEKDNLVPLCHFHNVNIHQPGFREIAEKAGLLKSTSANRHEFIPDHIGFYCRRCALPLANWRHREDAA